MFRSIGFRFRGKFGKVRKSKTAPVFFDPLRICFFDGKAVGKLCEICVKLRTAHCLWKFLKRCPVEK